jgi:integrase
MLADTTRGRSQRLGHSTIAVTADTYRHVTPDMDADAAERAARALAAGLK